MILSLFIVFSIYITLKIFIDIQEYRHIETTKTSKAIILDEKNFIKAASYKQSSKKIDIASSLLEAFSFGFWILLQKRVETGCKAPRLYQ